MIKYYLLFDLLMRNGMKKTYLLEVISAPTLAKLSKGEVVKTDIIDKICTFLKCQPGQIMEVFETVTYIDENGEEQTKEVPVNQKSIDEFKQMLSTTPMFNSVMNMYKESAKTQEEQDIINETEKLLGKVFGREDKD